MKRRRDYVFSLHQGGPAFVLSEYLDTLTRPLDNRGADEDHLQRLVFEGGGATDDVAVHLPAVSVAQDGDIEQAERFLLRIFYLFGQQDCARAGAEDSLVGCHEFSDGLVESLFLQELQLSGALAPG